MILRAFCSRVAAITLVCLGMAAQACPQSFPIFETEFARVAEQSIRLAEKKNRRLQSVWKSFKDGAVITAGTSIAEFVVTGRQRVCHRVAEGNSVEETESIIVDGFEYSRKNGGPWTKTRLRAGGGIGTGTVPKSPTQARMELMTLDGNEVRLLEEFKVEEMGSRLKFYRNRIWIDRNGLLLKQELSSGTVEPRGDEHTEVITYHYDPTIKIEPPIK